MQRRKILKTAVVLTALGGAFGHRTAMSTGANATPDAAPDEASGLLLVRWQLRELTLPDGATATPDDPSRYTVQFHEGGQVVVQADCNSGSGTYTLDGLSLRIEDLVTTLIGCEPGSIGSEFSEALTRVERFEISTDASDHMTLTADDGAALRFDPALTGVVWHFTRFQSGRGDEVVPDDPSRYTLAIADDGAVQVVADCNRGQGTARVEGDSIELTIAVTRMACPSGSLGDEYVGYLNEAVSWVVRDGQLHLSLPMDAGIASFTPAVSSEGPSATPLTR